MVTKHEKIIEGKQDLLLRLHPKVSAYCSVKLLDINRKKNLGCSLRFKIIDVRKQALYVLEVNILLRENMSQFRGETIFQRCYYQLFLEERMLELSCCKQQQKKSQPRNWFGEKGMSESSGWYKIGPK